jgi:hypothetical protein
MSEKYYQIGTHTAEQWVEIHDQLTQETSGIETVPNRCVECHDDKPHSPTRGTFLLTDEEAEALKVDPRIKFVNIDYTSYPEIYKPDPEELQATSAELLTRWQGNVKVYREFEVSGTLPITPDATDVNRTGYQLLRPMQKLDPWVDGSLADNAVVNSNIQQFGDARDVDVIVADDGGGWIGHPEFQNNTTGAKPTDYVGGNVLPGNGTCDVLDLVLDAPYHLDPDYFDADPGTRLTTRWDGTIVPVESFARGWWANSANRSNAFNVAHPNIGTVSVTSNYTRAYCNGSNTAQSSVGTHCTPCMALTYGRTQGWAYNANKWVLNHYGNNGADIEPGFDLQKIFHQTKPVNPKYGTKNPTVSSNSWGYRSSKGTVNGYYHFRTDSPVQYGGTGDEPAFIANMGVTGDSGRWKSEFKPNSLVTALDELCDSGVIFVVAAGNSNQKQVKWNHPDYNNYISATAAQPLEETSYFDIGVEVYGTTNRRGFPQMGGKVVLDAETGEIEHKAINIGALDDDFAAGNLERKVTYSDRGNDIDFYMPADGTLAANRAYTSEGRYPDTYPGFTADSGSGAGVPEDCAFGGTSAACPVAAGFVACLMGLNRDWSYKEVRSYIQSLDVQSADKFYYGTESTSATDSNWNDYNSLEGGDARVGYQDITKITQSSFPTRRARIGGGLNLNNLKIDYKGKFDRG